jgi:DNA-binding SARP family transcriptional activator
MRFRHQSMSRCLVACFVWLLMTIMHANAQPHEAVIDYGLAFTSHEATKDQRTSLDLSPDGPIEISNDFELAFDLSYQRLTNAFGYIVRVIANDSVNIDLVSSPEHSEFNDLNLIVSNSPVQVHYDFAEISLKAAEWNHIVISVASSKGQVSISWNGNKKVASVSPGRLRDFRFLFGANDFGKFNTSDVPPITLRNIEIRVKQKSWLKWELKKHNGGLVYDTTLKHAAIARNASWLIDKHAHWIMRKEFSVGKFPSAAFDSEHGQLFVSDVNSLTDFDLKSDEIKNQPYTSGSIIHTDANQLLFVPETGKLHNYNVATNALSTYNFVSKGWNYHDTTYTEPRHWHNNKFFNPVDGSLNSFGGYGYYSYSNTLYSYDFASQKWIPTKVQGSIPPRYLGALGLNDAKTRALIFGGYGSVNGKQEVSPQAFYDLHVLDLKTHVLSKAWELKAEAMKANTVFSNSLVLNETDSCFYVLAYPKDKYKAYLNLESYSLAGGERKILGDSILFLFHDVHSFCDLFYSRKTKELIAVMAHKDGEGYKFQVHSINYPPLGAGDTQQNIPTGTTATTKYLAVVAGVGILLLAFIVYRKRRQRKIPVLVANPPQSGINGSASEHFAITLEHAEQKHSVIDLFGGFQVIDKAGNDITHKFTSTLKEIFLFILLHSIKFDKGVATTALHETIWPDKDEINARNNRNVNLKKLRTLLQEIGDISIENTNSYVRVILDLSTSCDFQVAHRILSGENKIDRNKVEILLKYVRKGALLPNLQATWLDSFKSETSNRLIDVLLAYSAELDMDRDDKMLLDIADSIFHYDAINQDAMVLKCSVLNKKGKHSLAKNWYDHFAKEYLNLYGENYPKPFDEIVL